MTLQQQQSSDDDTDNNLTPNSASDSEDMLPLSGSGQTSAAEVLDNEIQSSAPLAADEDGGSRLVKKSRELRNRQTIGFRPYQPFRVGGTIYRGK